MSIAVSPGTVMITNELQWSLSMGIKRNIPKMDQTPITIVRIEKKSM